MQVRELRAIIAAGHAEKYHVDRKKQRDFRDIEPEPNSDGTLIARHAADRHARTRSPRRARGCVRSRLQRWARRRLEPRAVHTRRSSCVFGGGLAQRLEARRGTKISAPTCTQDLVRLLRIRCGLFGNGGILAGAACHGLRSPGETPGKDGLCQFDHAASAGVRGWARFGTLVIVS